MMKALEFYVGTSCGLVFVVVQENRWELRLRTLGRKFSRGCCFCDTSSCTYCNTEVLMFELVRSEATAQSFYDALVTFGNRICSHKAHACK